MTSEPVVRSSVAPGVSPGAVNDAPRSRSAVNDAPRSRSAVPGATRFPVEGASWLGEVRSTARAYATLAKPGIIWLLLVTTVPAMVMAEGGWPGLDLVVLVLLGGVLTSGGANALNQWYDRDIDAVMHRTRGRPIPQGRVSPGRALAFGVGLAAVGGVQLALTVNVLSAGLALAAVAFYVFVYTVWLKRSTPQNIVIGGAAGSVPPLVGWAAVQNDLGVTPLMLFLVIFLWTPPHFWALALRYKNDYARAQVPMLPVVRGAAATKRQIVLYAVVLTAVSALLVPFGDAGWLYLGVALTLGAGFVGATGLLWRGRVSPMTVFFVSIVYLPVLFIVAGVDAVL